MKTVLFACVHNAGRSQMAAALFNALADPNTARAVSAGTQPGTRVHPEVLTAMREVGVDLGGAKRSTVARRTAIASSTQSRPRPASRRNRIRTALRRSKSSRPMLQSSSRCCRHRIGEP